MSLYCAHLNISPG